MLSFHKTPRHADLVLGFLYPFEEPLFGPWRPYIGYNISGAPFQCYHRVFIPGTDNEISIPWYNAKIACICSLCYLLSYIFVPVFH